jgi:hypothetical protein
VFFSGPVEAEGGTSFLSRRTGFSGILWRMVSLTKSNLNRYNAWNEPQRASSFRKKVKAHQNLGETPGHERRFSLFVLLFTLFVVLAGSFPALRTF